MSLSQLKKSSTSTLANINKKIQEMANPGQNQDTRLWQPTVDKAGNGYAVIRFLPPPEVDEVPFVRTWDHGWKGPGGWYIETSLTTIGLPDPCGDYNSALWNSGNKKDQDIVKGIPGDKEHPGSKRRLHFYSNVLVVEDPAKPENNGKVFLFKYGKRIFEKLNGVMNPKFPDQVPFNPFDLWTGANFALRASKVDGQRNYNESQFQPNGPIAKTDAAIEAIWKQTYSLKEFTDPTNFKSYEELQARLERVIKVPTTFRPTTVEQAGEVTAAVLPKTAQARQPAVQVAPWETDEDSEIADFKRMVADG